MLCMSSAGEWSRVTLLSSIGTVIAMGWEWGIAWEGDG